MAYKVRSFFIQEYKFICSAIALIITFFIAFPGRFYFLNDDFIQIPLAIKGHFLQGTLYRPISDITLWIDHFIWGKNAFGYHLTNLIIHLINTWLVYKLANLVFGFFDEQQKASIKSFLASLLFLVYSYHSEPLFWILGRGGSLCTTFFLGAFYFFASSQKMHYLTSLVFFTLGLLTYELVWVFPLIITIFFFFGFFERKNNVAKLTGVWVFFILYLIFRLFFLGKILDKYELGVINQFRFGTLIYNFNTLAARCFLPPMESGRVFISLYVGMLFCFFFFTIKNPRKSLLLIASCTIVSLLPVVFLGIDTHDSESERYIYLATFFAVLFLVDFLAIFFSRGFYLLFTGLMVFHVLFLWNEAKAYQFSSMITRRTLYCFQQIQTDTLVVEQLPTQFKGALIFRIGFPEAMQWFKTQQVKNIIVKSRKEYHSSFEKLSCNYDVSGWNHLFPHVEYAGKKNYNTVFAKWDGANLSLICTE